MIYEERQRIAQRGADEAAGLDLWTTELSVSVRGLLVAHWRTCRYSASAEALDYLETLVRRRIELELGTLDPPMIETAFLRYSEATVLSYIESTHRALSFARQHPVQYTQPDWFHPDDWAEAVSKIFNSHRIAYKFVDGEIIPLESEELHTEVIEPAIRLLHGRPDLGAAEDAYRKALREISDGDAPDAITDAGRALQATLTALGCTGNALGPLIKNARKRGLLAAHDETLAGSIEKALHWVSADRSEIGDAHQASSAVLDDAWLTVHIVGALIVRLAGPPRSTQVL